MQDRKVQDLKCRAKKPDGKRRTENAAHIYFVSGVEKRKTILSIIVLYYLVLDLSAIQIQFVAFNYCLHSTT